MDKSDFRNLFMPCDIMIPALCEMEKWSVVACDQHTSEPEYWERADAFIGNEPSTLRMMLPEHTYKWPELQKRIEDTKSKMAEYKKTGVFEVIKDSYVYVERRLYNGKLRCGIVGAIDLENYDFAKGTRPAVRATEGTIVDKLPVRVKLRDGAPLELTHVLMLADDTDEMLIRPLSEKKSEMRKLYDFELMERGGHISGYQVTGALAECVRDSVAAFGESESFCERYCLNKEPVMIFAVGDGNHSLAAAKVWWEQIKASLGEEERKNHPARYAIVEIVNLNDESLEFLPINRVVFDVEPNAMMDALLKYFPGSFIGTGGGHEISFVHEAFAGIVSIPRDNGELAIGALSKFLDDYVPSVGGRIDYVHGDDVVVKLSQQPGRLGFVLPTIDKSSFFPSIIKDGVLPRKTFSMGSSNDKRYYLECRKIVK